MRTVLGACCGPVHILNAMGWKDRQGNVLPDDSRSPSLRFLYGTALGRAALRVLIKPFVSKLAGGFMDSGLSRPLISGFVRRNGIDLSICEERRYRSFNDFFTRRLKPSARVADMEKSHLISPCDGKLTVYTVTEDGTFEIKGTRYTLLSLLRDEALARKYLGGTLLVFRLTVGDYHRYCYMDGGAKSGNIHIDGVFHTVNPIACDRYPIYKENTREYCVIDTDSFGEVTMMEVGALLVGRILNHHGAQRVERGQEKGMFLFGGSTIVAAIEKDRVTIDGDIVRNTREGFETVVKLGEKIGIGEGNG